MIDAVGSLKHTEFLKILVSSMIDADIISYKKEFLAFIHFPTDKYYIQRLSSWLNRSGEIQDRQFRIAIENRFGFTEEIWDLPTTLQKLNIKQTVKQIKESIASENSLDIHELIPIEYPITTKQKMLLDEFKNLKKQEEIEDKIDELTSIGHLDQKIENQEFIAVLLEHAYNKGLYHIIVEFILPKLLYNYRCQTRVLKLEAHTLGSLENYGTAKHILSKLIHENVIENINLRTSAISNHKRDMLNGQNQEELKESLPLLIEHYTYTHKLDNIYSYYTGINLLYMVTLVQILFPKDKRYMTIDRQEIYNKSKPSLKIDKTHNDYYVTMSGFEFQLLLNREGVLEKIESFLANHEPHASLVERTVRQMRLFIAAAEADKHTTVLLFKKATEILEGYISI